MNGLLFCFIVEFIQNYVQLVWSEDGESSSVLRSISVVVDADSNDCNDDDENGIQTEEANIDDERNESVKGDIFLSKKECMTNCFPKEENFN